MPDASLHSRLDALLSTQLQGVMATQQHAQPYTSLMAFAHTPDLRHLIFATLRDTQKHTNLLLNAQVSFLIDDRNNDPIDYQNAVALSVYGRADAISLAQRDSALKGYLHKHPSLLAFVASADCALLQVVVSSYRLVSQFQAVEVLRIEAR